MKQSTKTIINARSATILCKLLKTQNLNHNRFILLKSDLLKVFFINWLPQIVCVFSNFFYIYLFIQMFLYFYSAKTNKI